MRGLLRDARFRRLAIGLVASLAGDALLLMALGIWVRDMTGSASLAGLTFLFLGLPALAAPFGGFLIDRVRRRPFLIAVNGLSALALLPLLGVHDRSGLPVVYGVAFAYGVSFMANAAALNGLLKLLIDEQRLGAANGLLQSVREALRLGGPLVGAGIYSLAGIRPLVALDAASFVAAALAVASLRVHEQPTPPRPARLRDEVGGGISHLRLAHELRVLLTTVGFALLGVGACEATVFALPAALGRPTTFLGVLATAQGAGALIGGLASSSLVARLGELRTTVCGLGAIASGLALAALREPAAFAGMALFGLGIPPILVAYATLLQRTTPAHLIARVSTASELVVGLPQTASIALGAALVGLVELRVLLLAIAGVVALAALRLAWRARALQPAGA